MRRFRGKLLAVAAVLLAALAGAGAGWLHHAYRTALLPVKPGTGTAVTVTIPQGASTAEIARILYDKGLIRHPLAFRIRARQAKLDGRLKAGVYRLHAGMSTPEILDKLARGDILTARFTIPEGFTVAQIIDGLVEMGLVDRDGFRAALNEAARDWPYLPEDAELREPLEGYLFPDTYQVPVGADGRVANPRIIVRAMLERFEAAFDRRRRERARELGLSVHEVVTLASIIEREAKVPDERPLISAVYHNRLRLGMKLDADPTTLYAVGRTSGPLTRRDLGVDSPYNTYRYPGLPPGPIGAPGLGSIDAALYPADTDYLYFVLRPDGSGRHRFARTLEEHNRNVRAWRAATSSTKE
ncbi:MAG TPA: endolytic transglycosylase MltG [Thermaerobacter sp.]